MSACVSPPQLSVSHMVEVAAIIAHAASTALPLFWKIAAPAVAASGLPVTAIQWRPCSTGFAVRCASVPVAQHAEDRDEGQQARRAEVTVDHAHRGSSSTGRPAGAMRVIIRQDAGIIDSPQLLVSGAAVTRRQSRSRVPTRRLAQRHPRIDGRVTR